MLVPILGTEPNPAIVFTERRHDLRRHAGEISFPGGRRDSPSERLLTTALREAHEEVGLDPEDVELVGALPPIGTFVTNYKVYPFVGVIPDASELEPNPDEVAALLRFRPHGAARSVRDAPARAPRRPDPHPHLPGGRPPHLGRDRPHSRRAARPRESVTKRDAGRPDASRLRPAPAGA